MEVKIESVPVKALLDTGAQPTIISRSTLHAVVKPPELELPTARLYGKDNEKGGKPLYTTAQVPLRCQSGTELRDSAGLRATRQ